MEPIDELLTHAETARILRVAEKTLYRWVYEGKGPPSLKIVGVRRYPARQLRQWMAAPPAQPAS